MHQLSAVDRGLCWELCVCDVLQLDFGPVRVRRSDQLPVLRVGVCLVRCWLLQRWFVRGVHGMWRREVQFDSGGVGLWSVQRVCSGDLYEEIELWNDQLPLVQRWLACAQQCGLR